MRVLEYDALRELLRGYVSSPLGEARLAALAPSLDRAWIVYQHALTAEIRAYRRAGLVLADAGAGLPVEDLAVALLMGVEVTPANETLRRPRRIRRLHIGMHVAFRTSPRAVDADPDVARAVQRERLGLLRFGKEGSISFVEMSLIPCFKLFSVLTILFSINGSASLATAFS